MVMSKRESAEIKARHSIGSIPAMTHLKGIIGLMFSAYSGLHPDIPGRPIRLFALEHTREYAFFIIAKTLRHNRDTGSILLDGFFVVVNPEFVERMIFGRNTKDCLVIKTSKEDMELWRRFAPALAERCRSWEHANDCKTDFNKFSICDCGLGKDAAQMPSGYEDLASFATRIALPLLSAVPYLESVIDEKLLSETTAAMAAIELKKKKESSASGNASCDNCGSEKPDLKVCSRCEKVKYCNHACQKAAWKKHKKVCKR
jgi:hypothetical protein